MGTTFIEEIREGDNVKSFDFETNSVVTSKVKKTFIHYNKNYIIINGIIKTTIEHRFYSNNEWVHAGNLSIGDKILQIDGSELIVGTIESNDELETVYNFHVERTHNYFAEGCLVHNVKTGGDAGIVTFVQSGIGAESALRVGIGNSGSPTYPLTVYGSTSSVSIWAQADIAAYSDIRVKTDIETITEPLNKVLKMRGVTFIRTDSSSDKRRMGVIAQEIESYVPEVVTTRDDPDHKKHGHKSVSYGNLTALLIEAIKEQQEQIEELKEEIKEIKDA
jgi:putative lipoic acid-binding regulatory protein